VPIGRAERREDRRVGKFHEHLRRHREREANAHLTADQPYRAYLDFKKTLEAVGITYQLQPSLMSQWGWPKGKGAAVQGILSPNVNWDFFDSTSSGRSSIQFSYSYNNYLGGSQNGATLSTNLGVLAPINDSPTNYYSLTQLTYSHEFPGNWLQITFGQYPFLNFDSNQYADNQQINFVNYSLAQNGSSAYLQTGLGGYVQVNLTATLSFAAGVQDANNVAGHNIQTRTFGQGPWASFGYVQWKPKFLGLGSSQYSVLYYDQPAVMTQPFSAHGWSFNGVQNLNDSWGLFARLNTSSGAISQIKTSAALGFIFNNPLGRDQSDQIGFGLAQNFTNKVMFVGQSVRNFELVVDAYWNFVIKKWLLVGPDFQFIIGPALHPNLGNAEVLTLRMTGLF
jgi:Carbohydrate-selective porin, OprB family